MFPLLSRDGGKHKKEGGQTSNSGMRQAMKVGNKTVRNQDISAHLLFKTMYLCMQPVGQGYLLGDSLGLASRQLEDNKQLSLLSNRCSPLACTAGTKQRLVKRVCQEIASGEILQTPH